MNRKEILGVLKAVKPALANKEVMEQTTSFIFDKKNVSTYNDEVMISHPLNLNIKGAVPAKEFYDLLSKIKSDSVKIKQKGSEVLITGDDFEAGISITEKIILPIKDLKTKDKWKKLSKVFCAGVEFCLFSAGNDYSKLILTHIHVTDGCIESTDNYRLTKYIHKDIKSKMLIPVTAAKELIKYNPTHYYQKTEGWIHCKNKDGVIFSFRTHSKKYPDTSPILKMTKPTDIKFPASLLPALVNAETLCKEELSGDKFVKVKIKGKEIRVNGVGEVGWYKASIPLKKSHRPIEFEINSKSFRDILSHLKKATVSKTKMKFIGNNFIHVVALKGD